MMLHPSSKTNHLLPLIQDPSLSAFEKEGIKHAFFTRKGGVSLPPYHSLNCSFGSRDAPSSIKENRNRIAKYLQIPYENLCTLSQVHQADVVTIRKNELLNNPDLIHGQAADAMVSKEQNIALAILTADCGPILFADPKNRVIGAAHGGWRGLLMGIIENTVCAMEKIGAERKHIIASLGPSIGPCHYEIGGKFYQDFLNVDASYKKFFIKQETGAFHFNLWGFALAAFEKAGLQGTCVKRCTYAEEELFFSYRRATHKKEQDYGRQLSTILLKGEDIV